MYILSESHTNITVLLSFANFRAQKNCFFMILKCQHNKYILPLYTLLYRVYMSNYFHLFYTHVKPYEPNSEFTNKHQNTSSR